MGFQADGPYNWSLVTSTPTPLVVANRGSYLCKAGSTPLQFQLPASCFMGFEFKIVGHSNLWQLLQGASQFCKLGILQTTPGVTGKVLANTVSDQIWVVCTTANLEFDIFPAKGNPTII
jgi:hypothetical protein